MTKLGYFSHFVFVFLRRGYSDLNPLGFSQMQQQLLDTIKKLNIECKEN